MIDYSLYLVTDDPLRYGQRDWLEVVRAAVEGGVSVVQYRDTESAPAVQYARILALRAALKRFHTPIVVNNDAALAQATGAEGVHVGQHDMPPRQVRAIVGPQCEIGLSLTDLAQVETLKTAVGSGLVDAIGIGPVFDARKTKADAAPAMGLEGLAAIVNAAPGLANCAIGGITLENAPAVLAAGAKGLAMVSAFSQAKDPYASARNFSLLFDHRRV